MKKNRGALACVLAVILIVACIFIDKFTAGTVSMLRSNMLDNFFFFIALASSEAIIFFFLTALFLWKENKRRWILPLWASLGGSALISFILKVTIQRERPFQLGLIELLPKLYEKSFLIWNFSFPSFQSMLVFSAVPLLSEQFPKLKKFWVAFAVLVAFSRIYFGLHFLSDTLAGAVIGYVIGMLMVKLEKENCFGKNIYNKLFKN